MKITKANLIDMYNQYKAKSSKELDDVMEVLLSDESYINDPDFAEYVDLAIAALQPIVDKNQNQQKYKKGDHVKFRVGGGFDITGTILYDGTFSPQHNEIVYTIHYDNNGYNGLIAESKIVGLTTETQPSLPEKPQEEKKNSALEIFDKLKKKEKNRIILLRQGDYYETFRKDATTVGKVLDIVVTTINGVKGTSFPYYELDKYLPMLTKAGHLVGICDGKTTTEHKPEKPKKEAKYSVGQFVYAGKAKKIGEITAVDAAHATPIYTIKISRDGDKKIVEGKYKETDVMGLANELYVILHWSENGRICDFFKCDKNGDIEKRLSYPLVNAIIKRLHSIYPKNQGYDKTKLSIVCYINGEDWSDRGMRFDIGSDSDDLATHVEDFAKYVIRNEGNPYKPEEVQTWKEGLKVLVPYLKEHETMSAEDKKEYDKFFKNVKKNPAAFKKGDWVEFIHAKSDELKGKKCQIVRVDVDEERKDDPDLWPLYIFKIEGKGKEYNVAHEFAGDWGMRKTDAPVKNPVEKPVPAPKPSGSMKYENALSASVKYIGRYAKLHGKAFNAETKDTMRKLLAALQKSILAHEIRKTDEYAEEIMTIQEALMNFVNNRANNMEIEIKNIERYKEIAGGYSVIPAITLLRSYIALVGQKDVKKKAESLLAKIEKCSDRGAYNRQLDKAETSLREYVDGKTTVVEADQLTLEGLYGLCGVAPQPTERKHSASAAELANTYFNCIHLKGKWEKLIGQPTTPFKIMIYGKPGHGKSTLALQHAGYLAENHCNNVLYVAAEEGLSYTMKEKLSRLGIKSDNLTIVDELPGAKELAKYDTVFIDSVNNACLSPEDLRKLPKDKNYVFVMQTTKDGRFRGSQEYLHDVDTCVKVEEMHAHTEKNRFGAVGDVMVMDGCDGLDGKEEGYNGENAKRFVLNYYYDEGKSRSHSKERESPEGIFMELLSTFGDDAIEFAEEMRDWCNAAKKGDHFEDEDVIIDCVK